MTPQDFSIFKLSFSRILFALRIELSSFHVEKYNEISVHQASRSAMQ